MISNLKNIDSSRKKLRSFGWFIGVMLIGIGGYFMYNTRWMPGYGFAVAGLIFLGAGWLTPRLLLPFHKMWMGLSIILGWIMTRVILTVVFYGILTPAAWVTRLLGTTYLELRPEPERESYWHIREPGERSKKHYEKQS